MIVKRISQLGDSDCREKSKNIKIFNDPLVKRTIKNLNDSMVPNQLIGMAAPQIGVKLRMFMTHMRAIKSRPNSKADKPRLFINPIIKWYSKERDVDIEGCGSVAEGYIFGPVLRSESVLVEAYNENGEKFELKATGLLARIIQHEFDHLDGIFFTDKITDNKKLMSRSAYIAYRKSQK